MEDPISLLRKSGALLEGHFLLSSGRHGDRYFQCAKLLQYPDRAAEALKPVAARIRADMQGGRLTLDGVVGPAMGGIIVAYELGRQLGLRAFFTEQNEAGVMALRRGFEVIPGTRLLIAEDVITTVKSSQETAQVLQGLGAQVEALACIVDRRAGDIPVPWTLYSACRVEAASWEPEDCELCKKGVPWVKPGSRK